MMETQVLVIGGGPVGLSTALHLAAQGVDCVLVEKHPTTARHPKASYFNVRTMEILRQLAIADDVYATGMLPAGTSFYTRLTGYRLGGFNGEDFPDHVERVMASTASPGCISSQIVLEAILKQHAERSDRIRVLFDHEKTAIEQDDDGARTTVLDLASGESFTIHSSYVVACEGVSSSTRQECGRKMVGPPPFGNVVNIYLKADLEGLTGEPGCALFWACNADSPGGFIGLGGDRQHWCFNTPYFPDRGERAEDFDEERCLERVYAALGTDRFPVEILSIGTWVLCGQVVDEYRHGRILFAGDTAHMNSPTGGFGFNSGMQETHNLAWKIAYVLKGLAPATLLDTYHSERRPVAKFNVEKSSENAIALRDTGATFGGSASQTDEIDLDTPRGRAQREACSRAVDAQKTHFLFLGQEIGYGYWDSPLIVPDGSKHYAEEHGIDDPVYIYLANARPGARAPHCWVVRRESPQELVPIHDLFGQGFVLLTGENGRDWGEGLATAAGEIPVTIYAVGSGGGGSPELLDVQGKFLEYYGIGPAGAVLVRPDGHVCWRASGSRAAYVERHGGDAILPAEAVEIALGRCMDGATAAKRAHGTEARA